MGWPEEGTISFISRWQCEHRSKFKSSLRKLSLVVYGWNQLNALIVKEEDYNLAWKGWQHMGEIVSSRLDEAALTDAPCPPHAKRKAKPPEASFVNALAAIDRRRQKCLEMKTPRDLLLREHQLRRDSLITLHMWICLGVICRQIVNE